MVQPLRRLLALGALALSLAFGVAGVTIAHPGCTGSPGPCMIVR